MMSLDGWGLSVEQGNSRTLPRRQPGLISSEFAGEFVVVDAATGAAHSLSGDAAAVWRATESRAWPDLPGDRVERAITALTALGLLEPTGITRRAALRGGAVGATALALIGVTSMALPAAALAASTRVAWSAAGAYSVTVPAGVTVYFTVTGAGGGGGGSMHDAFPGAAGGAGAYIEGYLYNGTGAQALFYVDLGGGGGGGDPDGGSGGSGGQSDYSPGGSGGYNSYQLGAGGGGGGGASTISIASAVALVAGAGGGGGGAGSETDNTPGLPADPLNHASATGQTSGSGAEVGDSGPFGGGGGGGGGASFASGGGAESGGDGGSSYWITNDVDLWSLTVTTSSSNGSAGGLGGDPGQSGIAGTDGSAVFYGVGISGAVSP